MKIQVFAIIFVIIILPITIVIGEYASAQIEIFKTEQLYDSKLITSTYDALKAFQINTFNDATSDIVDSKINSIEASVNAFYNSMESSFGLQGYSKEELKSYVPAIVYTMYDGYYIYSPYANIADTTTGEGLNINLNSQNVEYGFKPYVYYSCRYNKMNSESDFIINYSLDNYITVQGTVNGESVYKSGYLVTIGNTQNSEGLYKKTLSNGAIEYYYNGQKIQPEESLEENLVEKDATGQITTKSYKYVKLNGTKYYWDEDEEFIFYLIGGERIKQAVKASDKDTYIQYVNRIKINSSAIHYYESAYEFTTWVNKNLDNLQPEHAETQLGNSGNGKIFKNNQIEYYGSNFDSHRKEVIRYSIETNLSVAIANFNKYTSSSTNFQMPELKETDWDMLENEISIISFLQGLNIGGKIYNGYTVVTNNKTEEVVKEERIYISTDDGYYHKINDRHFKDEYEASSVTGGYLDLDFEIRKDGLTGSSYVNRDEIGCYTSIVGQEDVNNKYDSIYEYLQKTDIDAKIKKTYYTSLGRERWGTYKVENPSQIGDILGEMTSTSDYENKIVTDGLIRHLEASNIDGYGNNSDLSDSIWTDLSGHRDGIIHGDPTATSTYVQLDGNSDWIDLGIVESPYLTLEAIVEFSDTGSYSNTYILNNHEDGGIGILVQNNKIRASAYINGQYRGITCNNPIKYNTKYNIAVTYDGKQLVLYAYANGQLEKQTLAIEGTIKNANNNTVMAIGVNPQGDTPAHGGYTKMKVYSVKIYNKVLTQQEIEKNYNFGKMVKITSASTTPTQGEWSNYSVTVNVTASTLDMSGINRIVYSYDYTPDQWFEAWAESSKDNSGNTINVKGEFGEEYKNVTLYLKAIDNAGNESDIVSLTLRNDLSAPQILDIKREKDTITLEICEEHSGIEKIEYSYDNNKWMTENFDQTTLTTNENITTITGIWDTEQYKNQIIYFRVIDYAGNISEGAIEIIPPAKLDLNMRLDGIEYWNGVPGVTVGFKVGGVDKGYISDYCTDHDSGTYWEIYGIKINGVDIPYSDGLEMGVDGHSEWIDLNTITFKANELSDGEVSEDSLIVLKNTTYTTSGHTLTLSDGRKVTAKERIMPFDYWSSNSGIVTSPVTITANFGNTPGLIRYYNSNSLTQKNWRDLSGQQDGIIKGGTKIAEDHISLNGNDAWVNLGQLENTNEITLEARISLNTKQTGERIIMCNYDEGGVGLAICDGIPTFQVYIQGRGYIQLKFTQKLQRGHVYNISGTYDGINMKLYIDGLLRAQTLVPGKIKKPDNNTVMAIGANPSGKIPKDGGFANIKVYSARVYNRVLSKEEINENIDATK